MFLLLCILIIFLVLLSLDTFSYKLQNKKVDIDIPENAKFDKNFLKKCDIYVINLNETMEGRRRFSKIKSLDDEIFKRSMRFKGYYGKMYDYSKELRNNIVTDKWNFGKWKNQEDKWISMDSGEIGVSLSHYYLWNKISLNNKVSIILEDDAIKLHSNFNNYLSFFTTQLPGDWDFFLLGFLLHRGDDGKPVNNYITKVNNFVLMHAMLVSPKGARKAMGLTPIDMPIDSWLSKNSNKLNIYRHNLMNKNHHSMLIQQNRIFKQIKNTNNW